MASPFGGNRSRSPRRRSRAVPSYCRASTSMGSSITRLALAARHPRDAHFLVAVLQLVELRVDATAGQQLLVPSLLHDMPLVQHDDAVHVLDRGEAVRDDDRGPAAPYFPQGVLDQDLCRHA